MSHGPTSHNTGSAASHEPRCAVRRQLPPCAMRALVIWPGLDRARLLRTKGDPARIAALVGPRTGHSTEHVIAMLTMGPASRS